MNTESRTQKAAKNFLFSILGNSVNYIITFVSRTIFIYILGATYLGISGLFTNVLGMLSLAELGVGTAISFSLYKPLATGDKQKIKALIDFYRTAYRFIALVVSILGLILIPFLPYIIKGAEDIKNINLIYILYLTNTVLSYLITYKSTLLVADQKSYLSTNITTITNIVTALTQIVALLIFKNFIVYLVIQIVIQLAGKVYTNLYTEKKYPFLKEKGNEKLDKEERHFIFKKIRALMAHKVGDVAINQTDSIITSSFINVTTVGLVSNFTMIIQVVNSLINTFFTSAIAGLGNVIATETVEKKLAVFKKYDFLGFVFFGWSTVFLYFMLDPFVTIWIGSDKLVDKYTLLLLCINYYFTGQRISLGNIKSAAGVFEQDVWIPFAQAIVNIVVSIVSVQICGLPGIYIGTLLSSFIPNIGRPIIVYKYIFEKKSFEYFKEYFKRIIILLLIGLIIFVIDALFNVSNSLILLLLRFLYSLIIPFSVMWIVFHRSPEWQYCKNTFAAIISKFRRKKWKD